MVAPIVVAAGVAVISGLAQAYMRKKAEGAARDELNQIKAMYNDLIPPDFQYDIEDPPELIAEAAEISNFDWSKLTPEKYQVIGQFAPEIAPYVKEVAPQVVQDTAVGKEGMQSQLAALRQLQQVASGGMDPQFAQRLQEASDRSQQAAQSRQESIMQDYQRRGLLGSGTQLAAELSGAEGAMQRGAAQSQDAATQAYLNQLQALQSSAQLGGEIRGQELDVASRNAQIANAFNQRSSAAFQKYLSDAANDRNLAAVENLRRSQGVADKNVEAANRMKVDERDRLDRLQNIVRDQKIGNISAENAAKMGNWQNQLAKGELERGIQQQDFNNRATVTAGRSGALEGLARNTMQGGQTNAEIISGIGQGVQQGIMTNQQMNEAEERRKRQRAWDKKSGVEY